jgi:hypothetical protein
MSKSPTQRIAAMLIARVTPPDTATDVESVDLERRIAVFRATPAAAQPTRGELVGRAVEDTDFLGDIDRDPHNLVAVAANAAEAAGELWEEEHYWPLHGVPLALIQDVTAALVQYARDLFAAEDEAHAEARLDAIEAGDTDADDNVIRYPKFRSL